MKFAIGSDHRGVRYKKLIRRLLERAGHTVQDFGTDGEDSVDYPDYALPVCRSVARGENERGILICSTGLGVSMTANRIKGVRAALCLNESMAEASRAHNDSNVLCLGQDQVDEPTVRKILDKWLTTEFERGRHERRVRKMDCDQ